jgi:hypothetical protein
MPLSGFSLGQVPRAPHLADQPLLEALRLALPDQAITDAIATTGTREQRRRRLPARLVVALVIGMGLWARAGLSRILVNLVEGLRAEDPGAWADWHQPVSSALSQARQRLGPRPLRALFHRLAGPVASPTTPGAFLFGRRVLALDGVRLDLPDTPANAQIFGRPGTGRGARVGAFPQVLLVWLVEVGTHVLCDAMLRPGRHGEHAPARQLLRSVGAGMLVQFDCGLYSYPMLAGLRDRRADFLGRVGSTPILAPEEFLADGTYLTTVQPRRGARRPGEPEPAPVPVRVIEYTLEDPARPSRGQRYRLVTSLLDPGEAPAEALAAAYHQRWEIEGTADELKTHQVDRRPNPPIRSKRPREVVQEIYGLLLAHLAIRLTMYEAATAAGVDPDQLSFTGTLHVLRRAVGDFQRDFQRGLTATATPPFWSGSSELPGC